MVIGQMCVRGNSGGKVQGSRAVNSLADFLTTGGGHITLGAATAPRGVNSCLIKVPLPVLQGNEVHRLLLATVDKAFGVSPWAKVSMGITSFEPCSSGWITTTATVLEGTVTASGDTATASGDAATASGDTAAASGDTVWEPGSEARHFVSRMCWTS